MVEKAASEYPSYNNVCAEWYLSVVGQLHSKDVSTPLHNKLCDFPVADSNVSLGFKDEKVNLG